MVDYIGIANELKTALKNTPQAMAVDVTVDIHEAYAVPQEKWTCCGSMLHSFDYSSYLTGGHKLLAGAANHILGLEDGKNVCRQRPSP